MATTDWLCTLAQARTEIKVETGDNADDSWLISNIPLVSQRINNLTRLRFVPWIEKYYYDAFGDQIDDWYRTININYPMLEPIEVIDALGNVLVLGTDYVTLPQDGPAFQLQRINVMFGWSYGIGYGVGFWIAPLQWERAIKVTAKWGYRDFYPSEGWVDSQQVITNTGGINATQRTFTVADVNGTDEAGQSPALSVGNTLQVPDSSDPPVYEWMRIIAISEGDTEDTVTVIRGINGTQKATHPQDAVIQTWSVQPEIQRAAVRWLGYQYSRRGSFEAVKTDLSQGKTMIYPSDVPSEIQHIIEQTSDWRWRSV